MNLLLNILMCVAYEGECIIKQTHSALLWDYALRGCQMLQFDWSIYVICACIIRGSGIMLHKLLVHICHMCMHYQGEWYNAA